MTHTVKIYSFPLSGHAHRVELMAGLASIPAEVILVDLAAGAQHQPDYLSLNPNGQVPTLVDGDQVICDSNAILVYLSRRYAPAFLPEDPVLEAQVQKFLTLAAGELAYGPAAARLITVFDASLDTAFAHATAAKVLQKLERDLEGREFLVGEQVTIADVALYSYTAHAPEGNVSLQDYPNVRRWLANIEALPGFKPMSATAVGLAA